MIDLRATYDHVDRDMLFYVLNIRTKPPKITSKLQKHFTQAPKLLLKTLLTLSKCKLVVIEEELNLQFYLIFIWILY